MLPTTIKAKPVLSPLLARKPFFFSSLLWPPSGQPVILLFLITFSFQLLLVSRAEFLYYVCFALFYLLLAYLLAAIGYELSRRKNLMPFLLVLFSLALRLPFLFSGRGLIFTSDNALDALQTREIATHHLPPFFLLDALQHMGTVKYMLAAFFWEVFGSHYALYTLTQVLMSCGMLYCFYLILRGASRRPNIWLLVLLLSGFSFIETFFDNSLSLRGGSEFEMAFFFFLGATLLGDSFNSGSRVFLAFYFSFFSIYLHPLGASFAASLAGAALISCFLQRHREEKGSWRSWLPRLRFLFIAAAGGFLGLFHWIYYLLFIPKAPSRGGWEKLTIIFPSRLSFGLVNNLFAKAKACFVNLFNFEFNYMLDFFKEREGGEALIFLNRAIIFVSLIILLLAVGIAVRRTILLLARKRASGDGWPFLFFLFLSLSFLAKTLLVEPPLLEPRHNFDLLAVVILAYFIAWPPFIRFSLGKIPRFLPAGLGPKKIVSAVLAGSLLFIISGTIPHYYCYLKMTRHKQEVYGELLKSLYENRVRYLATDFIIAYPIHFLSAGKILVSDSLGPLTIPQFFPRMRKEVDKQPLPSKAFLFFTEEFPARPWHKEATAVGKARLFRKLKEAGLAYRSLKIKYFVLILPRRPLSRF